MHRLPWALVVLRLALGPLLAVLVFLGASGLWTVGVLVAAVLSDVFDGVVARRLGVATERLRRADSIVDTAFYLCVAGACAIAYPSTLRAFAPGLGVLVALEVVRYVIDLGKFGRTSAYHMWSAKAWGLTLLAGFVELFWMGQGGLWFGAAVAMGVVTNTEALAASLILREWHHDVPSLVHAVRLR